MFHRIMIVLSQSLTDSLLRRHEWNLCSISSVVLKWTFGFLETILDCVRRLHYITEGFLFNSTSIKHNKIQEITFHRL